MGKIMKWLFPEYKSDEEIRELIRKGEYSGKFNGGTHIAYAKDVKLPPPPPPQPRGNRCCVTDDRISLTTKRPPVPKNKRTFDKYISSEDIKVKCGADKISVRESVGYGISIIKEHNEIGYIKYEDANRILGDDLVIKSILIHGNEELTKELNIKYTGKILIISREVDVWN